LTTNVNNWHAGFDKEISRHGYVKLSLPDAMKAWVEAQTKGGQYNNASEYVRDLIRRDQREREKLERLQAAVEQGRSSGISPRNADEILSADRAELQDEG
jgi:antitoxin ParD1/3/4